MVRPVVRDQRVGAGSAVGHWQGSRCSHLNLLLLVSTKKQTII